MLASYIPDMDPMGIFTVKKILRFLQSGQVQLMSEKISRRSPASVQRLRLWVHLWAPAALPSSLRPHSLGWSKLRDNLVLVLDFGVWRRVLLYFMVMMDPSRTWILNDFTYLGIFTWNSWHHKTPKTAICCLRSLLRPGKKSKAQPRARKWGASKGTCISRSGRQVDPRFFQQAQCCLATRGRNGKQQFWM